MLRRLSQTSPAKKSWSEKSPFRSLASLKLEKPLVERPPLSPQAVVKVVREGLVEVVAEAVVVVADLGVEVVLYVKNCISSKEELTFQDATGENGEAVDALPLTDVTNEANQAPAEATMEQKARTPRPPKQRGPPEDGIPSTTKVMVANLPYDLSEEKVHNLISTGKLQSLTFTAAQGTLYCVRARLCQDRPSTHSSVHG
jgi:hypothetical protein